MKEYHDLLQDILDKGTWKDQARPGMPRTLSLFGTQMRFDLRKGFPLVTTKKLFTKGIFSELNWMIQGKTNIKYLVDQGAHFWIPDAYRHYKNLNKSAVDSITEEEFGKIIKEAKEVSDLECKHIDSYNYGDLGPVYGQQWRAWNTGRQTVIGHTGEMNEWGTILIDQLQESIDKLKKNPMDRRNIVSAWNPAEISQMGLPPCHIMYQFNCRALSVTQMEDYYWNVMYPNVDYRPMSKDQLVEAGTPEYYLDVLMYQRSVDSFLGLPFNIACYSALTQVVAKMVNMIPGEFVWTGGDTHIYEDHMDQIKEQLSRDPNTYPLPTLKIKDFETLDDLTPQHFEIIGYESYPKIEGKLSVGI